MTNRSEGSRPISARIRASGSVRSAVPGEGVIQPLTHVAEGAPLAAVVSADVVVFGVVDVSGVVVVVEVGSLVVVDGGAVIVTASDDTAVEAGGTVVAAGRGSEQQFGGGAYDRCR